MGQLEPGTREGVGKLVRVLQEAARDLLVGGIEAQRQIGGQHGRHMLLRGVVRVRGDGRSVLRLPLERAGRALGQLPFEAEQGLEEVVVPLRRRLGPSDLEAAADGVTAQARAELALPAEALVLQRGGVRRRADQRGIACAVGLAEGVAAGDQRDGLLVVHRHAEEGLADVAGGRDRVRLAVRSFRVDVDEAHLHGGQRLGELALAAVALVAEPGALGAPVELLRLPHVGAAAGEAEGLEAHRFQRGVAGQDHQVRPGDLAAVFLLDRPQQPARAVEQHVVRPRIQRREALLAGAGAAAAVGDAVGAGAVPGHAHHQAAVMAEIGRPPVLRIRHQCLEVGHHGVEVEALELLHIVEVLAHRVGPGGVAVQDADVQVVRPPVAVARPCRAVHHRALACALGVIVRVHRILLASSLGGRREPRATLESF